MAGKIIADQIEHSTAGSLDTSYVVNGSAKASVNFTQVSATTIRSSLNISSLTDVGTGQTFPISFTSAMADSDYAGSYFQNGFNTTVYNTFNNQYTGGFGSKSTSGFGTFSYTGVLYDSAINDVIIHGDLA